MSAYLKGRIPRAGLCFGFSVYFKITGRQSRLKRHKGDTCYEEIEREGDG
jgi:hypothetical protein